VPGHLDDRLAQLGCPDGLNLGGEVLSAAQYRTPALSSRDPVRART
jgi:hypothetical protein